MTLFRHGFHVCQTWQGITGRKPLPGREPAPAEPEKRGNYDFMNNYFPFFHCFFIIYVIFSTTKITLINKRAKRMRAFIVRFILSFHSKLLVRYPLILLRISVLSNLRILKRLR